MQHTPAQQTATQGLVRSRDLCVTFVPVLFDRVDKGNTRSLSPSGYPIIGTGGSLEERFRSIVGIVHHEVRHKEDRPAFGIRDHGPGT